MQAANRRIGTIPILISPSASDIRQLMREVEQRLTPIGLTLDEQHLPMLTTLCRMLLPDLPLDALVPAVMQAVWVYWTDALVDAGSASADLEVRLRAWQSGAIGGGPTDPGHRLLGLLHDQVAGYASAIQLAEWWAAACQFLDAQLGQRFRPASSYLGYLALRPVAQAIPLTVTLAAILYDCSNELERARTAQLLWWAGCYMGLVNDLASYQREIAEGVAATANARGVLAALIAQSGGSIDERATDTLVQADIQVAWHQLTTLLGPRERWSSIDGTIARFAYLLHSGAAQ